MIYQMIVLEENACIRRGQFVNRSETDLCEQCLPLYERED